MAHPLTNIGLVAVLAAAWAPSSVAWAGASVVPQETPAPLTLQDRLAATAVYDTSLPPRVVYTWTTAEQVAELRGDPTLLTRTESPVHGQTKFTLSVEAHGQSGDAISALLSTPRFARHRYAWNQPWGAAAGWEGERYGEALIRVELREEAWMGIFDLAAKEPWRFVDRDGSPVTREQVLANPERVGVVLHISNAADSWDSLGTFSIFTPAFREYVLVNAGMIESWELGTSRVNSALAEAAALVEEIAAALPPPQPLHVHSWNREIRERWAKPAQIRTLLALYEANLAFPNAGYLPRPEVVRELSPLLTVAQPGPLQHRLAP